jgi:glycosyltransferase A (GT-A) superfamily protein (DUF2064 family)
MTGEAKLVIMAKAPRLGQGKTRLARDIGLAQALRINRGLHRKTFKAAADGPWRIILAVTPRPSLRLELPGVWPSPKTAPRIEQGKGDLSVRIARAVCGLQGPVCVIGTDAPGLTNRLLRQAFAALRRSQAVLGPATDGGFWLVGARRAKDLVNSLEGVRWSTAFAAADIAARLPKPLAYLPALTDVDDLGSLRQAEALRSRARLPSPPFY